MKNPSLDNLGPRASCGLAVGRYQIDRYLAVTWSQNTGRKFDNRSECSRVANRPDAFWTVASKRHERLRVRASEHAP